MADIVPVDPNNVSEQAFRELLEETRQRAGGKDKLARLIGVSVNTLSHWLRGEGPSASNRRAWFLALKNIQW